MQMIWSAALGDAPPPCPLPHLLHLPVSIVPPLSLRRNAFCFACCFCPESHLFLLLLARLLFCGSGPAAVIAHLPAWLQADLISLDNDGEAPYVPGL